MSDTKLSTIREIRRGRFVVEIAEHVEFDHPEGTVATGDPEADAEYVRKIETGEYPWFTLGVHVYVEIPEEWNEIHPVRREIGSSYLGWCDTTDLRALGVRDVVAEAIADARNTIHALTEER